MQISQRKNAFWLLLTLLAIALTSGCKTAQTSRMPDAISTRNAEDTEFIYFVPADANLIESELNPEVLLNNATLDESNLMLTPFTDWEQASAHIASNDVKAILIHHAAFDSVNQEELQTLFEGESLVVTGIGIPGLKLAEFLGHPALFTATWPADEGYTTPYYFYAYSLNLSRSKAEIERLREFGWAPGEEFPTNIDVSDSVGATFGSSTDSLLTEGSLRRMLNVILSHVPGSTSRAYPAESVHVEETAINLDYDHLPPAVNEVTGEVEDYILVPHLIAPEEFYEEQPVEAPILGVAGFPVARLADAQAEDVQRVALFVAESGAFADEEAIGFGILSSIRYIFADGRTLYISTTHLSPAAMEQTISFSGNAVMLPAHGEAWLDTGLGLPTTPRSLNFVKDDFIITVTGDLAVDDLLAMADQLVFE